MKKDLILKKMVVNSAVALVLIGAVSTPARAISQAGGSGTDNALSQVLEQLNHQLQSWRDYLDKIAADKLKPLSESLGKDIDSALGDAMGVLGLPDPIKSRGEVEKVASSSNNPVYSGDRASNEVDRYITRGAANATLSREGQQAIKQQADKTQNSVDLIEQQAQAARGEVVTQNVMKQIALQNVQTGAILGSMKADSLQTLERQELTNLNLTNISRSVDAQNQAVQAEKVGTGLDTLRITSRSKLF